MKRISDKRRKELAEYSRLRKMFLIGHPFCQVCIRLQIKLPDDPLTPRKARKSKDVHHKFGRVADLLNDAYWWYAVCRQCHDRIHNDPAWARSMGFLPPKGQWLNPPKQEIK